MHRLIERIRDRITVDQETGCWDFNGDPSSNGYQRLWCYGIRFMAHRFIYETLTGKNIVGKQLDHLCENRKCCNPEHLDPCDNKTNSRRKYRRRKLPPPHNNSN